MRVALDSNILVYLAGVSHGPDDADKIARLRPLIQALEARSTIITPIQTLGELFVVCRRSGLPLDQIAAVVRAFGDAYETPASDHATLLSALDLAADHKLQFWDALIISAAAAAGCSLLLSEDMQNGFAVRGLTIVNPFAEPLNPKLAALVAPR